MIGATVVLVAKHARGLARGAQGGSDKACPPVRGKAVAESAELRVQDSPGGGAPMQKRSAVRQRERRREERVLKAMRQRERASEVAKPATAVPSGYKRDADRTAAVHGRKVDGARARPYVTGQAAPTCASVPPCLVCPHGPRSNVRMTKEVMTARTSVLVSAVSAYVRDLKRCPKWRSWKVQDVEAKGRGVKVCARFGEVGDAMVKATPIPRDDWVPGRIYLAAWLQDMSTGEARRDTRDMTFAWEAAMATALERRGAGLVNGVAL